MVNFPCVQRPVSEFPEEAHHVDAKFRSRFWKGTKGGLKLVARNDDPAQSEWFGGADKTIFQRWEIVVESDQGVTIARESR